MDALLKNGLFPDDAKESTPALRNAVERALWATAAGNCRAPSLEARIRFADRLVLAFRERCTPGGALIAEDNAAATPRVHAVAGHVAGRYNVPLAKLCGRERAASVVVPRQVAMYCARKFTNASFPEIGRYFGRDHATVISAVAAVRRRLGADAGLVGLIDDVGAAFASRGDI